MYQLNNNNSKGFGLKQVSFAYVKIAMSIIQPSRGQYSAFIKSTDSRA